MRKLRRVVTEHAKTGRSVVISDEMPAQYRERSNRPGVGLANFCIDRGRPAESDEPEETCTDDILLHPPASGSTFRQVEFLPEDPEVLAKRDGKVALAVTGAGDYVAEDARHWFRQHTDSLDDQPRLCHRPDREIWTVMDREEKKRCSRRETS